MSVTVQPCGAARTVTGSCYVVDTGKFKFVVDCGAFQGSDELDAKNREDFPFEPSEIEFVLLTHAHFDHCGRLAKMYKEGFRGRVISTDPTRDLAEIVMLDAAYIQSEDFKRWEAKTEKKRKYNSDEDYSAQGLLYEKHAPIFEEKDVRDLMPHFETYPVNTQIQVGEGVKIMMRESGHILGSVIFEVWVDRADTTERPVKIIFSGDLGHKSQKIVKDAMFIDEADYVFIESTYGNRLHKSKKDTVDELYSILKRVSDDNGIAIMPTFAIERAQELLYEINEFEESGKLSLPVYLDSPMAIKATEVFKKYPQFYDKEATELKESGDDPFSFPKLKFTEHAEESKRLVSQSGMLVMAGSGMCTGGRVIHHLYNHVHKPNTHVIFVGFQVPGTLGRRIVDRVPGTRIKGKEVEINAQIHTLGGFSAHADRNDLLSWIRHFKKQPKKVFVMHGEEETALDFAQAVMTEFKEIEAKVPHMYEVLQMD